MFRSWSERMRLGIISRLWLDDEENGEERSRLVAKVAYDIHHRDVFAATAGRRNVQIVVGRHC